MVVIGQRHTPVALSNETATVPIVPEAGWAAEYFCTGKEKEKIYFPQRDKNLGPSRA